MQFFTKALALFIFALGSKLAAGSEGEQSSAAESVTVLAAGDIARCPAIGAELTAKLIERLPGYVLALGDLAYSNGTFNEFNECYDPTWGRFKNRTYPVPGNHEYDSRAVGYFKYWGKRAAPKGKSYYSFDLGFWHLIALDSNLTGDAASEQERWLRRDLVQAQQRCILSFWHHPTFSSGWHGSVASTLPLFQILYEAGATLVLAGHDHHYERFAPQDGTGQLDPERGIRSFVVGTGGTKTYPVLFRRPNSEIYHTDTLGVLKLTLAYDSYEWEFIPASETLFQDKGNRTCVDRKQVETKTRDAY